MLILTKTVVTLLFKVITLFDHILGGASRGTTSTGTTKGVDVDAVGTINGVPTYDFDLDGLQADDKPWRKPGKLLK